MMKKTLDGESLKKKNTVKSKKNVKTTEDEIKSPKKISKKAAKINFNEECVFQKSPTKKSKISKKEPKPEK